MVKGRPATRVFDGRHYRLNSGHKSKAAATKAAEKLRKNGYNARRVEDSVGWATYRGLPKPSIKRLP